MKKMVWIAAIGLLSPVLAFSAGGRDSIVVTHEEPLQVVSFGRDRFGWSAQSGEPGLRSVTFDAFGRRFALELVSNQRLIDHALRGQVPDAVGVYRGRLADREDSWVRLVVADGVPRGLIWDGDEMLAVEARSGASGPPTAVIFRLQDVYVEPGSMTCGNNDHVASFAIVYEGLEAELYDMVQAAGAVEELNVGLVADYELFQTFGAITEVEMLTRLSNVDGIFSEQLGVQLTAREIETFSSPDDPFTTAVPNDLLTEVAAYRRNTAAQAEQGITYLFTGRDLDGQTVGIAYRGAICSTRYGAGLGEAARGVTTDSFIAAHEIGHLFGAEHDGEAGSVCESVSGDFLMSPRISNTDEFSGCSIDTMRPFIDSASCINPLPEADVSVVLASGETTLLLGDSFAFEFDIVNNGTLDAANVTASFEFPTILSPGLVSTTAGSCTSGAGRVECDLGTIVGTAAERISVAVTGDVVGSGALSASVAADADADLGNNMLALTVTVDPATDLLVRSAATASVTVDDAVTIRPIVENLSSLDATSVALDISIPDGLRPESASWPDGNCTIGTNVIDCQRASLAAGSQVAVDIHLTGLATGTQSYTATVSSSDIDRDESNNTATGEVTVSAVGSSSSNESNSGGGAANLLWLLLVAFARLRCRGNT